MIRNEFLRLKVGQKEWPMIMVDSRTVSEKLTPVCRAVIRLSPHSHGSSTHSWIRPRVRSPDHRFSLEFETGAVWQSRNQIQIPDNS